MPRLPFKDLGVLFRLSIRVSLRDDLNFSIKGASGLTNIPGHVHILVMGL
jgi:hypothetical protein